MTNKWYIHFIGSIGASSDFGYVWCHSSHLLSGDCNLTASHEQNLTIDMLNNNNNNNYEEEEEEKQEEEQEEEVPYGSCYKTEAVHSPCTSCVYLDTTLS